MADSPKQDDWTKPAAMAIPKEGFFKLEQGRYGPIFPKTPACHGFSIIAKIKPGTEAQIRAMLMKWRDNDGKLRPLIEKSSLLQEVAPLSQDLSSFGSAGLQALDYLASGEKAPEDWKNQQLSLVQQAFRPKAQLLLMVADPVQKLIQASAGETPTDLPIPKNAAQ